MQSTTFSAYGVAFSVHCPEAEEEVFPRLEAAFPPGCAPLSAESSGPTFRVERGSRAAEQYDLRVDGERLVFSGTVDEILETLEGELQLHVAEYAEPWIFLHAGVVGWGQQALVLPGGSCAGKSTLVASLLRAGATYFSDEYAVLDQEGRVHPYPRRLSLRRSGRPPLRVHPGVLGASTSQAPLPVSLIAILAYQPQCTEVPTLLRPGQAILHLLQHVLPARRRPSAVLDLLSRLVRTTPVLHGPRGEADETARRLLLAVEEPRATPERPLCLSPAGTSP